MIKSASENQTAGKRFKKEIYESMTVDTSVNYSPVRGQQAEEQLQRALQYTSTNFVNPGPGDYQTELAKL
jgi:hypothetical protein